VTLERAWAWLMVVAFVGGVLMLGACHPLPPPVPPPKPPAGEPSCATACDRLREMRCRTGDNTPAGATCEDVCGNMEDSRIIAFGVDCVTRAESCAVAESCGGPR